MKTAWKICYAVQITDCARSCDRKKKFHLISRYFSTRKTNTSSFFPLFFFMISNFSCSPSSLPSSSLISLFLRSRSTLSANSSLSAVQKWLCLADSTDKRLNVCCPQRRRRRGKEGERKQGDCKQRKMGKLRRHENTILVLFVKKKESALRFI